MLAAPAKLPKMSDKTFKSLLDPEQLDGVLQFKATVIVVNNTLVQQVRLQRPPRLPRSPPLPRLPWLSR